MSCPVSLTFINYRLLACVMYKETADEPIQASAGGLTGYRLCFVFLLASTCCPLVFNCEHDTLEAEQSKKKKIYSTV